MSHLPTSRPQLTDPASHPARRRITLAASAVLATLGGLAAVGFGAAHAADAPFCPAGKTPVYRFHDDMENSASGNWAFTHGVGPADWANDTAQARSGVRALHALQRDLPTDMYATRTATITPAAGDTTYLRFNHRDEFWDDYDGGVVEYSTNGGGTWKDAGPMFIDNGYYGTMGNPFNSVSALAGRPGFNGPWATWTASRLDISPLAGKNVLFRFRVASDEIVGGGPGWYIDDIDIYTCTPIVLPGAPTAVAATATNRGATVTWTPPAATGNTALTGYLVMPLVNGQPGGSMVEVGPTATSATVPALTNGTAYSFQVFAKAEGGTGPGSVASAAVTPQLPATTGSLVFVKGNNVWLSGPYGENARALTTNGTADIPYWTPSQSDDGNTIVAVRNEWVGVPGSQYRAGRVVVMNRQGTVLRTFVPAGQYVPEVGGCRSMWRVTPMGIEKAEVSPDGTKVAYGAYAVLDVGTSGGCSLTNIGGTSVANLDGTGAVLLRAADGNDNFMHPSWASNTRVLVRLGFQYTPAVYTYDLGGTPVRWFGRTDSVDNYSFRDPVLAGNVLAEIADTSELRLWTTNGAPTKRCTIRQAHGAGPDFAYFRHPTWSPDSGVLAWDEVGGPVADRADEGIYVSPVGAVAAGAFCPSHDTATLVIQGGTQPSWGPAPVGGTTLPVMTIKDATVTEGAAGTTTVLAFKVKLSAASAADVTVRYTTSDGTALAGADYKAKTGTLTIPAGSLGKAVRITVNGDATHEGNETLTVTLSTPTGATVGDAQAMGTITNDD